MKALVTYLSQTGNTRKVAQAIYAEIMAEKELKEISQVKTLEGYDMTFVGFPILRLGAPPEVAAFLKQHAAGKMVALFITHAASDDFAGLSVWLDNCKAAASGTELAGLFHCQGELGEQIANIMLNSGNPELAAWAQQRPATLGQPDAASLSRARAWARQLLVQKAG